MLTPEREYAKEDIKIKNKVKFRIFPTDVSIRHGMEISLSMIRALKEEIEKSQSNKTRLILHFHEYHTWQTYLILLLIQKKENVKIFAQHHGGRNPLSNLLKYKRLFLFFPVIAIMQFFENLLFKKIDLFYVLSDEEKKYLKDKIKAKIIFQTMGIENYFFKEEHK